MDKEKRKTARRNIGWVMMRVSSLVVKVIPFSLVLFFGRACGFLWYYLVSSQRKTALEGLQIAFGESKTAGEIKNIARRSFSLLGEVGWEMFYFLNRPFLPEECVEIRGIENLRKALEGKKGVIALTAHFGNFPLLCLKLKRAGFVVNAMARPMRDQKAGDFIHQLRTKAGVKTIFSYPRKTSVFGTLKALQNNEIVVMQMDQNFGTGGVWVNFFGKLAATPVGPIVLGARAQAAIVPMFIVRNKAGRHTLFIEKQVQIEQRENRDEAVLANAIKYTQIVEQWIRRYPHLWGWIHRRWKSRPNKRVLVQKYRVQKL